MRHEIGSKIRWIKSLLNKLVKIRAHANVLEGRNAAGRKLGKKRSVIPSTQNVLSSKEPQLCGCG